MTRGLVQIGGAVKKELASSLVALAHPLGRLQSTVSVGFPVQNTATALTSPEERSQRVGVVDIHLWQGGKARPISQCVVFILRVGLRASRL